MDDINHEAPLCAHTFLSCHKSLSSFFAIYDDLWCEPRRRELRRRGT